MSASVADILRAHGLVPTVPTDRKHLGNTETQVRRRVPSVPTVPTQKYTPEFVTAKPAPEAQVIRARLLALAATAFMDAKPIHALSDGFLRECDQLADDALRALLSMLRDDADRRAGRVPASDTAPIMCLACGPVFVHPSIATVLPVVDGWPRALGCPWCFIRKEGLHIPRPPVTCATCRHFQPDAINLAQGMGHCTVDAARPHGLPTYPGVSRRCMSWRPMEVDDD